MTGTPCEAVWLPLQCLTTTLGSTHCQAIRRKKKKKRHPKCAACLGICDDDALNSAEFSKEARGEFASKRHHWGSRQKRRPEEVHLALRRNQKATLAEVIEHQVKQTCARKSIGTGCSSSQVNEHWPTCQPTASQYQARPFLDANRSQRLTMNKLNQF